MYVRTHIGIKKTKIYTKTVRQITSQQDINHAAYGLISQSNDSFQQHERGALEPDGP